MKQVHTIIAKPSWLLFLLLLVTLNFAIIGTLANQIAAVSNGASLLDFAFGHTPDSITGTLTAYGNNGLSLYRWIQRIDLIHPLLYSLLLVGLFHHLYAGTQHHKLIYLPLLAGGLDYAENILLQQLINTFPHLNPTIVQLANIVNLLKNGVLGLVILALIGGGFHFLQRRREK